MATTRTIMSSEKGKAVTVTVHVNSNGEVERVDPKSFAISKSLYQQVVFKAIDGKAPFNIEFKKGSPFDYNQFSEVEPYSGLVRREVLGDPARYYEYTVSAGGKSIDPGGVVNP